MTVQEVKQALGSWHITLKQDTPRDIMNQLEEFGHIAIFPGRVNPKEYGDGMLLKAHYVGPLRSKYKQPDGTFDIKGVGMAYWLGDEDDKGDVFETEVDITAQTFANTIRALLPPNGAVIEGTLTNVSGTYTGRHQYETPRKAITYVTDTYSGTEGSPVEWRVNGNGTLDAGPITALYQTTPTALLVRKDPSRDMQITGVKASMSMDYDIEDYTTRVVLLAEGEGASIPTADADAPPTPYNDIHGNPVISTRLVSESGTSTANAAARAALELNRWQDPRMAIQINSDEYDIRGDFVVGDYVNAYDPDNNFLDDSNQIMYKGQPIHPVALRVIEMNWPVRANWTVAFRKNDGIWIDLSEYYKPETGATYIAVGDYLRTLAGFGEEHVGIRPNIGGADSSIPDAPDFTGFSTGSYQSGDTNTTKSAIRAQWNTPLNVDGSTVQDGDHYEIRHRVSEVIGYTIPWDILSGSAGMLVDSFDRSPESGGWGTPEVGASWTITNGPDVNEFFTDGSVAKIEVDSVAVERAIVGGGDATDVEIYHRFSTDVAAATEDINTYVFARFIDTSNNYRLRIAMTVGGGLFILCEKVVGGVLDDVGVGFVDPPAGHIAGAWYNLIFRVEGTSLRAKVWMDGEQVPTEWQFDETDSDITGAGQTGIRAILTTGNTNGTVVYSYDAFAAVDLDGSTPYDWDSLGSWDSLISEPVETDPQWETKFVGWGTNAFTIMELTPGVVYELQIRGVDAAKPPNFGPWSASSLVRTVGDLIAPSTPAGPEVAASMTAVQVVHQLGRSSGGTFNLEPDIDHLDVFMGGDSDFEPLMANKIGELIATAGMLLAATPAVGTFAVTPVDEIWVKVVAVDRAGNRSASSVASPVTAELIDDAHISDLTVSKLTAGTINSVWVNAGMITTAPEGARVELTSEGIKAYDSSGNETVAIRNDGSAEFTGQVQTSIMGDGVSIVPGSQPRIRLTPADDVNAVSILKSWISGLGTVIELGNRLSDELTQHGGNLLMFEGGSIVSHSEEDATDEGYLWLADDTNGGHIARGKWYPSFTDNRGALYPDLTIVGAGFGALSVSYPATMIGGIAPMFTVFGASPNFFWCCSASNATGAAVAWSDALAHTVFQWIFRRG
jgi:hypothetical protein